MGSPLMDSLFLTSCRLCPRNCGVDRTAGNVGVCGGGKLAQVAKVMLHHWEEPCISGQSEKNKGSGAVFFAHCSLGCVYCQNYDISTKCSSVGKEITPVELSEVFLQLQDEGAYNINLVTPTHYAAQIAEALRLAKANGLTLPVVWNTGGYESVEVIENLAGLVDVYLTDFKYADPALAKLLSHAENYPESAKKALVAMLKQTGAVQFDEKGMLTRGVILRHLCLPGYRADSMVVLHVVAEAIAEAGLDIPDVRLSLMRQYTPEPWVLSPPLPKSLTRRVTSFEYDTVLTEAQRLGFEGYTQEKESAVMGYTPDFS